MTVLDDDLRPGHRDGAPVPETAPPRRITPRRALAVAVAVAAVAAVVLGTLWALALNSSSLALGRDRDAALVAAKQSAVVLNTLSYKDPNAGLDQWEQVSTGQILDEVRQNRDAYAKAVGDSKRSTVAGVPDAAVGELDERAGIARVLVDVDVSATPEGGKSVESRLRLQLEMTRTDAGWKVSKLSPVRTPTAGG